MEFFSFLFNEGAVISNRALGISACVFLWCLLVLFLVKWISGLLAKKVEKKWQSDRSFFRILANISWYSCIVFSLFIASLWLPFNETVRVVLAVLFIIAVWIEVSALVKYLLNLIMEKWFRGQDAKTKKNLSEILNTIMQIVVWVLATLIVFDKIGVAITPFLTSLGIWWIAVAFAAQKLLEDFFSSFSIMWSTPFRIWDFISVAWYSGTVKKIGLRTTTLQTIEWATVVIPNRTVVADVIENTWTIRVRRKRFSLAITYETSVDKYRKIPELLEKIINKQEKATYEWALLKDLADSSVEVLVSYTVASDDLVVSLRIHDAILLEILETFAKEWIDFAYPTQTLYTKK